VKKSDRLRVVKMAPVRETLSAKPEAPK